MNISFRLLASCRALFLCFALIQPAFAGMILLSETRSVTASYYGNGTETIVSDGTFGLFDATAVGIPFGGGFMSARQKSTITPTEVLIEHFVHDMYGPGGWAYSEFQLTFALVAPTRITLDGYSNMESGFVSLVSASLGPLPLIWTGADGDPNAMHLNYLNFDRVLDPGLYTLSSYEFPREFVSTRFHLQAASVPEAGSSLVLLGIGMLAVGTLRARARLRSIN